MCQVCYRVDKEINYTLKCSGNYSRAGFEEAERLEQTKPNCALRFFEGVGDTLGVFSAVTIIPAIILMVVLGMFGVHRFIAAVFAIIPLVGMVIGFAFTFIAAVLKTTTYYRGPQ